MGSEAEAEAELRIEGVGMWSCTVESLGDTWRAVDDDGNDAIGQSRNAAVFSLLAKHLIGTDRADDVIHQCADARLLLMSLVDDTVGRALPEVARMVVEKFTAMEQELERLRSAAEAGARMETTLDQIAGVLGPVVSPVRTGGPDPLKLAVQAAADIQLWRSRTHDMGATIDELRTELGAASTVSLTKAISDLCARSAAAEQEVKKLREELADLEELHDAADVERDDLRDQRRALMDVVVDQAKQITELRSQVTRLKRNADE